MDREAAARGVFGVPTFVVGDELIKLVQRRREPALDVLPVPAAPLHA